MPLIAIFGHHFTSSCDEQANAFLGTLASWQAQTIPTAAIVSISVDDALEPVERRAITDAIARIVDASRAAFRLVFASDQARSTFQHYETIVNLMPQLAGDHLMTGKIWVLMGDSGAVWHPERVANVLSALVASTFACRAILVENDVVLDDPAVAGGQLPRPACPAYASYCYELSLLAGFFTRGATTTLQTAFAGLALQKWIQTNFSGSIEAFKARGRDGAPSTWTLAYREWCRAPHRITTLRDVFESIGPDDGRDRLLGGGKAGGKVGGKAGGKASPALSALSDQALVSLLRQGYCSDAWRVADLPDLPPQPPADNVLVNELRSLPFFSSLTYWTFPEGGEPAAEATFGADLVGRAPPTLDSEMLRQVLALSVAESVASAETADLPDA